MTTNIKLQYDNCPNCFATLEGQKKCRMCGYDVNAMRQYQGVLQPFQVLNDRYLTGRVLGRGGFGVTYLAQDLQSGCICCIKEYMPTELANRCNDGRTILPAESASKRVFEHGRKCYIEEARTLIRMNDIQEVVKIYDFFEENRTAYFVMEYLDGVSMKALGKSYQGKIPIDIASNILVTIANTLTQVHNKGILHRDISPENIFITKNNQVKLIDFGAARSYINSQDNGMSVLLKPGYAPPEQYNRNGSQGPWTDIYALAASFYTSVSNQKLIDAMLILKGMKQPALVELNCGVSKELSDVIQKAMEVNYLHRYQDAKDFLNDLSKCICLPQNRQKKPYLELLSEGLITKWEIVPNVQVSIGRAMDRNDFVIHEDTSISRVHIYIAYNETSKKFLVTDKSANGVYLMDGSRLEKNIQYSILPGTELVLATKKNILKVCLR